MIYSALREKITANVFLFEEVIKAFPEEKKGSIHSQLHRLVKTGSLLKLRQRAYCFSRSIEQVDKYCISSRFIPTSYISAESVLQKYGILPVQYLYRNIYTGVTNYRSIVITPRHLNVAYKYSRIKPDLFFGYKTVFQQSDEYYYNIATIEKALLDYIYLRRPTVWELGMLNLSSNVYDFDVSKYMKYAAKFPGWMRIYTETLF